MTDEQILTNPCDEHFANVKLLVVFDGNDGSKIFKDSSPTNKTPQTVQNVVITTEQKKFRTGSGTYRTDGSSISSGPHLIYGPGSDLNFGEEWTLDFYLYVKSNRPVGTSSGNEYFMSIGFNQYFYIDTQSPPMLHCTWLGGEMGNAGPGAGDAGQGTGLAPIETDRWNHIALMRLQNNEWYFYLNGKFITAGVGSSDTSGGGE